jgi:hypothetical protein
MNTVKTGLMFVAISLLILVCTAYKSPEHIYILSKVRIECISQCDDTGSDQVFVTIPESLNSKTSATRSFKPGNIKSYTEIGPNNGSGSTAWIINAGDKIKVYEKDLLDPDDLIKQINITSAICNGQQQTVTGTNGNGKYKIYFTIAVI